MSTCAVLLLNESSAYASVQPTGVALYPFFKKKRFILYITILLQKDESSGVQCVWVNMILYIFAIETYLLSRHYIWWFLCGQALSAVDFYVEKPGINLG
jgi:hypothetical protein